MIHMRNNKHAKHAPSYTTGGQTIMIVTVLFLVALLTIVSGFAVIGVTQARISRDAINSDRSYFAVESVLEDIALRLLDTPAQPTSNYALPFSYTLSGLSYEKTVNDVTGAEIHRVSGSVQNAVRSSGFVLLPASTGTTQFTEDLQVGTLGIYLRGTSRVYGSVYSNGPVRGDGPANNIIGLRKDHPDTTEFDPGYLKVAKLDPNPVHDTTQSNGNKKLVVLRKHADTDNLAQKFYSPVTGMMQGVDLRICRPSGFSSGNQITILLRDDAPAVGQTNAPGLRAPASGGSGTNATTPQSGVSICPADFASNPGGVAIQSFTFTQPVLVEAGKPYWIIVHSVNQCTGGCPAGNQFYLWATNNDATTDGYRSQQSADTETITLWSNSDDSGTTNPWCKPAISPCAGAPNVTNANTFYASPYLTNSVDLVFSARINTEPYVNNVTVKACADYSCSALAADNANDCTGNKTLGTMIVDAWNITNSYLRVQANRGSAGSLSGTTFPGSPVCSAPTPYTGGQYPFKTPPITEEKINEWITKAKQGCHAQVGVADCGLTPSGGGFEISAALAAVGPLWITGDLHITSSSAKVPIQNYIYIDGDLTLDSGNCFLYIHPGVTQGRSLAIVVSGQIRIRNDCEVRGRDLDGDHSTPASATDDSKSHLILVSQYAAATEADAAIELTQSAKADVLHAEDGMVVVQQTASLRAAYGLGLVLYNSSALVSFLEGPGNLIFVPTGLEQGGEALIPRDWGETY